MRVALDTNIMAYAEGVDDLRMQELAADLILKLSPENTVLPLQTLGELYNVLTRKSGRSRDAARTAVYKWRDDNRDVDGHPFARDGFGDGSLPDHLGCGYSKRGGASRLSLTPVGGSAGRVYLERRHGD